jgi:hypothetical protein
MMAMHRQEVNELMEKLSGSKPGSKNYLAFYGAARRKFEETLTETQRQSYKAMAKEWSDRALPEEMQRRYLHSSDSSA